MMVTKIRCPNEDCNKVHDIDLPDGYGVLIRCSCGAKFMYKLPIEMLVEVEQ